MTTITNDFPQLREDLLTAEHGTEEFGKQVMMMNLTWVEDAIVYCINQHVNGLRHGKHDLGEGVEVARLAKHVRVMAGLVDENLAEMMETETDEETGETMSDWFVTKTLEFMVEREEIEIKDGKAFAGWEVPEEEDESTFIDGVRYPNVTVMSPKEIIAFANNQKLFQVQYPNGNYNMIRATSRHLMERQIDVTQQEINGKMFYMYSSN